MKKRNFWLISVIVMFIGCMVSVRDSSEKEPYLATLVPTKIPPVVESTAVEPLPEYLGFLKPGPGETYTLTEYENLAPTMWIGATEPGICFSIFVSIFMEPGDFPTAEEWLKNVYLVVNTTLIPDYHSLLKLDSEGLIATDPKTGEIIWKEPSGSPLRVCYAVPLEIGQHTASIVVEKTSGEQITYTWPFTITK